jgi:hypothetical protein
LTDRDGWTHNDGMTLFVQTVPQFLKMLSNLDGWLDLAVEHGKSKGFDVRVLLDARLAPDQFALKKQVQAACDQMKTAAARLSGAEPPAHPDTEQTLEELRARIATVRAYLSGFSAKDFEGAEARVIPLPFIPGKGLDAQAYVTDLVLPNTYFHLTTAYAILRHNGVDLGKRHFIGAMPLRDL